MNNALAMRKMSSLGGGLRYLPWYRIAEPFLGNLVPKLDDKSVVNLVSPNGWLIFPTQTESERKTLRQTASPNLYFSLNGSIDLGLVCYTNDSIEKMRSFLLGPDYPEKSELLGCLKELDSSFETSVGTRTQEGYHRRPWKYREILRFKTNTLTDEVLRAMFEKSDAIIARGRKLRNSSAKFKRMSSYIALAETSFPENRAGFEDRLTSLLRPYQIVLGVATPFWSRQQKRISEGVILRLKCPNGHKSWPSVVTKRCPECKSVGVPE
jgi:hypothetical protein